MRKLIVSEFMSIDGVMQAPGGKDEDRDGGFEHGGWTMLYWHDEIGARFVELLRDVDALLLGRRTYVIHAEAFEPMPSEDPFGDAQEIRCLEDAREADLAKHDDHPRQRHGVGSRTQGRKRQEHLHRRQ